MANRIPVMFFQRKARKVGNYSVEFIFDDVRNRLKNRIDSTTYYSTYESSGFFKRLYNCIEAFIRQKAVVHVTGDVNYIGLFLRRSRTIHTILDCVFLTRSSGMAHKILKYFWLDVPVKRSVYITAISESTKKEILKYSSCNPDKIIVIPVAISERFRKNEKPFNKQKPVILQIGTAPNKNLPRLFNALKGISCELHIVGQQVDQYISLLKDAGLDYTYQSNLSEDEMLAKYHQADIISFASTYEGFGMPILEAQAVGRVVVTSRILSMPEVAGDAACFVDPFDESSIRSGILKVIEEDGYRAELINRGFSNISRFHPEKIAEQYYELYKNAYSAN